MMQFAPNESFWRAVGVEIHFFCPEAGLRHKTKVLCNADVVCAVVESCVVGTGGLAPPLLRHETMVLRRGLPRQDLIPNGSGT